MRIDNIEGWKTWESVNWKELISNSINKRIEETFEEEKYREDIWKDLISKHLKVEYYETLWLQWRKVVVDIPIIWNFWWCKFELFISDEIIDWYKYNEKFNNKEEYNSNALTYEETENFTRKINEYMKECGVKKYRKNRRFDTLMRELIWYNDAVWLKNKYIYSDVAHKRKNAPDNYKWWHILLKI